MQQRHSRGARSDRQAQAQARIRTSAHLLCFSPLSLCSGNKNKTFKPVKSHPEGMGNRSKLSEYAKATLGSGNMRSAVVLPKGEEINEWLAVNSTCAARGTDRERAQSRMCASRGDILTFVWSAVSSGLLRRRRVLSSAVDFFNEISLSVWRAHAWRVLVFVPFRVLTCVRACSSAPLLSVCRLYGTITEFCTSQTCPVMSASAQFEYLWCDNEVSNRTELRGSCDAKCRGQKRGQWLMLAVSLSLCLPAITRFPSRCSQKVKKPIKCSAPEYVDYLMSWVESQLNNEHVFPLQLGTSFPKNFQSTVKVIFKRLFRVYAHIYHSHFQKIVSLGAEAHLNTCFSQWTHQQHSTQQRPIGACTRQVNDGTASCIPASLILCV